jgi:hypothetical protein
VAVGVRAPLVVGAPVAVEEAPSGEDAALVLGVGSGVI